MLQAPATWSFDLKSDRHLPFLLSYYHMYLHDHRSKRSLHIIWKHKSIQTITNQLSNGQVQTNIPPSTSCKCGIVWPIGFYHIFPCALGLRFQTSELLRVLSQSPDFLPSQPYVCPQDLFCHYTKGMQNNLRCCLPFNLHRIFLQKYVFFQI